MTGKRPFYFLVFALIPLFFFIQAPERVENVHQFSLTLLKPLLGVSHALRQSLVITGQGLATLWDLYHSHSELLKKVEGLERELIEREELRKENERLRDLIKFKSAVPGKAIAARVVARDLAPWRRTIIIDKGSTHGVRKRMAVINARGLVGRVVEAAPFNSRVILLLDPESRVSTLFQDSRDSGVAEGDGSSFLRVTHIDRESQVKVDDRLISSGLGGVYPKGIPIGKVEMVGTEKEGLELFATVRPFVNFWKLEEVLCVALSQPDS